MSDNIIRLKCNHNYHVECIKKWLCNSNNNCPLCKQNIIEEVQLQFEIVPGYTS